jgi:hypothetical protein
MNCNVNGVAGMRACTCDANGMLNCPGNAASCIRPDAGFNMMCMNNAPCTAGFTCNMNCNVNGVAGMRACTCDANGMLNCPGNAASCIRPDAGIDATPVDAQRPPVDAPRDVPVSVDSGPG